MFLSWFSDENKERLSRMLASDEFENEQPQTLESLSRNKLWAVEIEEAASARGNRRDDQPSLVTPVVSLHKKNEPLFDEASGQVHIPQSDSSRDMLALKKNIFMALQDIPSFVHKPWARDLML